MSWSFKFSAQPPHRAHADMSTTSSLSNASATGKHTLTKHTPPRRHAPAPATCVVIPPRSTPSPLGCPSPSLRYAALCLHNSTTTTPHTSSTTHGLPPITSAMSLFTFLPRSTPTANPLPCTFPPVNQHHERLAAPLTKRYIQIGANQAGAIPGGCVAVNLAVDGG
jgi:hypothetical protein